jgi:hypothetical protein
MQMCFLPLKSYAVLDAYETGSSLEQIIWVQATITTILKSSADLKFYTALNGTQMRFY